MTATDPEPNAPPAPRPGTGGLRGWGTPLLLYASLAALVCAPSIAGRSAIGPDRVLDADSLYGALPSSVVPVHNDPTPVVLDLPRDLAVARGLRAGRLDAWNPHVACGAPLWAEQGGPFFPLKIAFYLHPSRATHHLFLALRLMLAALGAFALARRRGLSQIASLFCGALFELSGSLFAHLPFAAASAVFMLPWVLLAAQWVAEADSLAEGARATALAALVLGTTGHAGHPTLVAMVWLAFALAVVGHVVEAAAAGAARSRGATALLFAMMAGLLALAIAAPALLPLAELASVGRSYKDTDMGESIWRGDLSRFRATTPLALFAPHLLGTLRAELDVLFPYLFAPALGVVGLGLALGGVLTGALRPSLALPAALGLLLALMPPGLDALHRLPLLRLIMPQYPWSLVQLPLCVCAGAALDAAATGRGRRALVAGALLVAAGCGTLELLHDNASEPYALRYLVHVAVGELPGQARLALPLLAGLLLVLLLSRAPTGRRAGAVALVGAAALLELGLITVPKTRLPAATTLGSDPSGAVRYLQDKLAATQSRFTALPYQVGIPNTPMVYGLDDFREISALPVARFLSYISAMGKPTGFTVQAVERYRASLYDLAAVRYFVVRRVAAPPEPNLARQAELPLVWSDAHVAIYENRTALPRYRISHEMRRAGSRAVALYFVWGLSGATGAPQIDGPVAVEEDASGSYPEDMIAGRASLSETVRRVDDGEDPDQLALEVKLDRAGLVVVADTYYPGWEATIDGAPTNIYPAEALFRAVQVPAGTHRVEMRYRPRSLRVGLWACGVALSACALLLWATRRARRGSTTTTMAGRAEAA